MVKNLNTMAGRLSLLRSLKKVSLREVERETRISNAYLSQIETDQIKDIGLSKAVILAEYYGVTVQFLATGEMP